MKSAEVVCVHGWEALRADPMASLLNVPVANVRWRVLHELVGRPLDSPAVRRARGGANVEPEVAPVLTELDPDGRWPDHVPRWKRYTGSVWRLVAAVGWGADPTDPRIQRAAERLLARLDDDGAFDPGSSFAEPPCVVARVLEALSRLGFGRDLRFQQALAWLEEHGWHCPHAGHQVAGSCAVTAVATAAALHHGGEQRRNQLRDRAHAGVLDAVSRGSIRASLRRWGHPNLLRTDIVEMLHLLATVGAPYHPGMRSALLTVQAGQDANAWWSSRHPSPCVVGGSSSGARAVGEASPWVTLRAVVALVRYAPEAELPRRFPAKP